MLLTEREVSVVITELIRQLLWTGDADFVRQRDGDVLVDGRAGDARHAVPLVDVEGLIAVAKPGDVLDPVQPTGNRARERER